MSKNMQMKKETGKILHRKFLSENIGLLLIAPVFLLLMFTVSNLYQLPAEYVFYLTSIFLILWVTTLCMQYWGFRKRTEQYEKESKEKQESNSKESRQWEELQEKQDFFALWAHQIKTPIAALNLLLQGEKQDAAVCRQELFKIESYVEMALNYLRFEEMSNDLVLERNSLEQLVRQVVKKYAAIFIYNHISIQLEHLNYTVLTDEKWFCFALEQILSNALKYTKQGSVKISAEESANGLKVSVKDTGIGIRSEDLPRIFEKGFTGYNGRMDKKASGLGLYLCKGVCEKLGHGISVASKEGEGTTVMITLQCEKSAAGRSCEYVDLEKSNILFLQKCKIMTRKCKPKKGHYISFFAMIVLQTRRKIYVNLRSQSYQKSI